MFKILLRKMCTETVSKKPPIPVFGIEGRYVSALYSASLQMNQIEQVEKHLRELHKELLKPKVVDFIETSMLSNVAKAKIMKEVAEKADLLRTCKFHFMPAAALVMSMHVLNTIGLKNVTSCEFVSIPTWNMDVAKSNTTFKFEDIKSLFDDNIKNASAHKLATLCMPPSAANFLSVVAENGRLKLLRRIITMFLAVMGAHRNEALCEVITAKPLDNETRKSLTEALKKFVKEGKNIQLTEKVDPSIIGGMIVGVEDKHIDMSIARKIQMYTDILKQSI